VKKTQPFYDLSQNGPESIYFLLPILTCNTMASTSFDVFRSGYSSNLVSPSPDLFWMLADYDNRGKRGALELALMMKCASPRCDPIDYKGYGCYCGFMGAGVATDGIDK
jgi:hypothetical protein